LLSYLGDGYIVNVDFVFLDKKEKQIQRTFKLVKLEVMTRAFGKYFRFHGVYPVYLSEPVGVKGFFSPCWA
jgi:hypothetical protein